MLLPWMLPADLATGDAKSLSRDWSGIDLRLINAATDPDFETAFGILWEQFGEIGEMEQRDVIARRLQRDPRKSEDGCALLYELMLLNSAEKKFAAVRDHTAIVLDDADGAVVHLSHNLIAPEWRRTGLAGWLRALPVQTARTCLAAQRRPANSPITLVAEMEHRGDSADPNPRLIAYEKAGYRKIDPSRIPYFQPDFRAPETIDAEGAQPLPLSLVVRRIGRETEETIPGWEVRDIATALYKMFAASMRASDIDLLLAALATWPASDEEIALVPPTSRS